VIGKGELQQFQASIDGVDEAEPASEGVDKSDAAAGDRAGAISNLLVNVAGGHHGLGATAQIFLVQTPLNPALAVGQFASYDPLHSKSFRAI
jgi:hypothetical protein